MKVTKSDIIRSAVRLFNEYGYKNVSVDRICEECGVTKGSFYHHFQSKDDVILQYWESTYQVEQRTFLRILSSDRTWKQKLWSFLEAGVNHAVNGIGRRSMAELWRVDLSRGNRILNAESFLRGPGVDPEYSQVLLDIIRHAQREGEIRSTAAPEDLLFTFYAALFGASVHWSMADEDYDVVKEIYKIFLVIFE